MSETTEEVRQDLLDIRHFSERMLRALYAQDEREQQIVLFDLAKLICLRYQMNQVGVYTFLIGVWNGETAELRLRTVSDDHARQTVFRIFGELFAKYGLPDPGYEEDEL